MMEDPKQCPKCGHKAVRVRYVNPKGREITSWPIWLFFAVSVLILMGSFFGSYGDAGNHLVTAIPGIILVLIAAFYLFLFSRMPKRFRCDNAHTWDWPL
jgi:hypothetical protein